MTRFCCVADLHLGAHPQYADDRLGEQRAVWERALQIADEKDCDAVLFGGDAFEGPIPTPEQYEALKAPLRDFGLPVVAISGNGKHDAAMRTTNALQVVDTATFTFTLHVAPGITVVRGTWVACLPWTPVNRILAAQGGGDRDQANEEAAEMLLSVARGLRAHVPDGHTSVLLTHFAITGDEDGLARLVREPVLPVDAIAELGFDAVVAGHFHRPQLLAMPAPAPLGFYCGSPLPLDFSEGGYEHGVWLLDVEPGSVKVEFVPIESRRFVMIDLDATVDPDALNVLAEIERGDCSMHDSIPDSNVKLRYRVTAEQAQGVDEAALRRGLFEMGAHRVYPEREIVRVQRARIEGMTDTLDMAASVAMYLDANQVEPDVAARMRAKHDEYAARLV